MDIKTQVLQMLRQAGGADLSGQKMALRLGVSRNAVWKAITALRQEGYEIGAGTNRGYVLLGESQAFTEQTLLSFLEGPAMDCVRPILLESTDSTNSRVKLLAEQGAPEGTVVLAGEQTGGKGRLGRSFHSPKGTGLYLSVLLRPDGPAQDALLITTQAAAAAAEAIGLVSGRDAKIKWVNDVYLDGYKVCGILTEASFDLESGGLRYAVLGIGINLAPPQGGFPEDIRDVAGALFEETPSPGVAAKLSGELLSRFFRYYRAPEPLAFLSSYRSHFLLTGVDVEFERDGQRLRGRVLGVDDRAGLRVRLEDTEEELTLSAGEVSLDKSFLKQIREEKQHG